MEKLIECYSLQDLLRKIERYRAQGGTVLEDTVRRTGDDTYVFVVDYANMEGEL